MNERGFSAYAATQAQSGSVNELDALVLSKAARALVEAKNAWETPEKRQKLQTALELNLGVWTTIYDALSEPDHPLPIEVRENLVSLARYVIDKVIRIEANPSVEMLDAIIDVNMNIAAGLRAKT